MGKYLLDFSTLGSWDFRAAYCHAILRIGKEWGEKWRLWRDPEHFFGIPPALTPGLTDIATKQLGSACHEESTR